MAVRRRAWVGGPTVEIRTAICLAVAEGEQ